MADDLAIAGSDPDPDPVFWDPANLNGMGEMTSASFGDGGGARLGVGKGGRVGVRALYDYLVKKFAASGLLGYVPPDGAKWGIRTGSAQEWAAFALAVAKQESDLNPRSFNAADPGGSYGLFQFGRGQGAYTQGTDQYDPQNSADSFVRSVEQLVGRKGQISDLGVTFGSIRRPQEAGQYIASAQKVAAGESEDLSSSGYGESFAVSEPSLVSSGRSAAAYSDVTGLRTGDPDPDIIYTTEAGASDGGALVGGLGKAFTAAGKAEQAGASDWQVPSLPEIKGETYGPPWYPSFGPGMAMPSLPDMRVPSSGQREGGGGGQNEGGEIPSFQEGGIVTEPTVALVGESGPEMIMPLGEAHLKISDDPMSVVQPSARGSGALRGELVGVGGSPVTTGPATLPIGGGGLNITRFGYPSDPYWDTASGRGEGAHVKHMIPGYDVALNKAGVAQVGAQPGQPFSYQGRQYRWGDNVPELYSDARMDIFDPYYGPQTGQKHAPYAFGDGGIVREPTVALLGEKGPEAVVPLKRDELEDYLSRGEIPNLAGTQKFWTQTLTQEPMPSSSEFEQWKKAKAQDFLRRIPGSADEPARVPLEQYPRMNLADPDVLHVNATRALEQMQRVVDATYATTGSEQLR